MTRLEYTLDPLRAIFKKEVRRLIRYPGEMVFVFLIPYFLTGLVMAMGISVGGASAFGNFAAQTGSSLNPFVFLMIGTGVWMVSWVIMEGIGTLLREEQMKGTLEQNFLAPINRFLLLVGTALSQIVITSLLFVGVVAVSVLLLAPQGALGLLVAFGILMIGLIPLFGIGFVFAALVVRFKEPYAFTQTMNVLFGVLAGAFYNVTVLPSWVRVVSAAIPQSIVIQDMRLAVESVGSIVGAFGSLIALLTMGLVYPVLGYYFFKQFERRAKISGDLSKF
ncbi:ABC transporter permease [Candidatus Bathyarchaeota archaeon]|nr:MAG: ABC transporter permease [Candidatus Bathyarchaeota archaeon]TMI31306.1 MAG: ABC transporter permease [Candidatus Bathyarchaeota archaeon]